MKCREAARLMSEYLNNELDAGEKSGLEEHLSSCGACREDLKLLKKISGTVKTLDRFEPPASLKQAVLERIASVEIRAEKKEPAAWPLLFREIYEIKWQALSVAAAMTALLILFGEPSGFLPDGNLEYRKYLQNESGALLKRIDGYNAELKAEGFLAAGYFEGVKYVLKKTVELPEENGRAELNELQGYIRESKLLDAGDLLEKNTDMNRLVYLLNEISRFGNKKGGS